MPGGFITSTVSGTVTPRAGGTRLDVYLEILAHAVRQRPDMEGSTVLFFDLQPNRL
ncbi:hypothetical protein [Kitasatospora fiedleri]|uniref:hypothetical protein n=1 Tax=Kitasatospora fiedleri TaxID=2991545 RepID=UPI00249BFCB9|nr:hypothetical protein [Kitasatospora fiedleri]